MTTNAIYRDNPPEKQCAKLKKPFARRKRRGFISIEYMFVLGLVIIGIVGVIALAGTMQKSWRATQLTTHMAQIVSGLQRTYASSPTYDDNLVEVLDAGGNIPAAARVQVGDGPVSIVTPYGGAITLDPTDDKLMAVITISKLPEEACERFLQSFVGLSVKNSDIRRVAVNDGSDTPLPLERGAILTACDEPDENTVAITY